MDVCRRRDHELEVHTRCRGTQAWRRLRLLDDSSVRCRGAADRGEQRRQSAKRTKRPRLEREKMRHGDKLAGRRKAWQCMLIHDRDRVAASIPPSPASSSALDERPMKPLIIGIAGGTGSGKSTVARNVAQALSASSVAFIDMDAYYRNFSHVPLEERRQINWDHPDAFDWELLLAQLSALVGGQAIEKPVYDFVTHTRSATTVRIPA